MKQVNAMVRQLIILLDFQCRVVLNVEKFIKKPRKNKGGMIMENMLLTKEERDSLEAPLELSTKDAEIFDFFWENFGFLFEKKPKFNN